MSESYSLLTNEQLKALYITHRNNLAHLEKQAAMHGSANVPLSIANEIRTTLSQIQSIITIFTSRGVLFDDNDLSVKSVDNILWEELLASCISQTHLSINALSYTYNSDLYINRGIDLLIQEFIISDKPFLSIVDISGVGKTNSLCNFAHNSINNGDLVVFLIGDIDLNTNNLEQVICSKMMYTKSDYNNYLQGVSKLLEENNKFMFILVDGISESVNINNTNYLLRSTLPKLKSLKRFKFIFTCRESKWNKIIYNISIDDFYKFRNNNEAKLLISDFNESELILAIDKYKIRYNVEFKATGDAFNQIKHPFLLKLFCIINEQKSLGNITSISTSQIFEKYIEMKSQNIEFRSNGKYHKNKIVNLLIDISGNMWTSRDIDVLNEDSTPLEELAEDRHEILEYLVDEGIITTQINISYGLSIRFAFIELKNYLLLKYLIRILIPQYKSGIDITKISEKLLITLKNTDINAQKLLSLIGIQLPQASKRRGFLKYLLRWDFATFCHCISNLSYEGDLHKCNQQSLFFLAEELRRWYSEILEFCLSKEVLDQVDPWEWRNYSNRTIKIKLIASPECKEISYSYLPYDSDHSKGKNVLIEQTSDYPTWHIGFGIGDNVFKIHDPDNGLIVPIFRKSIDDFNAYTIRTINFRFHPRFSGDSFNIPERIALFDILGEIEHLLTKEIRFPQEPIAISNEAINNNELIPSELSDDELSSYLQKLFIDTISSYKLIVERYFPNIKQSMNFYNHIPGVISFVSNRIQVRYQIYPDAEQKDIKIQYAIAEHIPDLNSPELRHEVYDDETDIRMLFNDFAWSQIRKLGLQRNTVHPIDLFDSIDAFFSKRPCNDLVIKWILMDIKQIFGFMSYKSTSDILQ